MNSRKKLLLDSWLSVFGCLLLFVGISYAWFHAGNSIKTDMVPIGEMAVELVDMEGVSMESKKLQWNTKNSNYWEPGCTYYTEPFTVTNKGDIYFKYKMSVEGFSGDMELLDVITFHIYRYDTEKNKVITGKAMEGVEVKHSSLTSGASYVVGGTMKKEAGNSYQGKKLRNATVVLKATQLQAGNAYGDVAIDDNGDVDFSKAMKVTTAEELKAAVAKATESAPSVIVLENDIELSQTVGITGPTQIYSFGHNKITLAGKTTLFQIQESGSLYLEGVTLTAQSGLVSGKVYIKASNKLELRDCEVEGVNVGTSAAILEGYKRSDMVLTNVKFAGNVCQFVIRDYDNANDSVLMRNGSATTKIQYCNFMDNQAVWMFWIRSNYSVSGGVISGNKLSNAVFRLNNIKNAKLSLRYVALKNNVTSGNQAAIAWVQSYATMTVGEGTVIEGNTASQSYGNIKAGANSILKIDGGTISPIAFNGQYTKETDNFSGIVNDNAGVTISAEAVVEGTCDRVAGYQVGTPWPAK